MHANGMCNAKGPLLVREGILRGFAALGCTAGRMPGLMQGPQHPDVTCQTMPPLISIRPLCCSPAIQNALHRSGG